MLLRRLLLPLRAAAYKGIPRLRDGVRARRQHRALLDLPRRPARRRAARPRQKISYFKNRARHPDARPRRPRRMPPRGRPRKNIRRHKNAQSRRPAHRRADDDRAAGTGPRKQPCRPARARRAKGRGLVGTAPLSLPRHRGHGALPPLRARRVSAALGRRGGALGRRVHRRSA